MALDGSALLMLQLSLKDTTLRSIIVLDTLAPRNNNAPLPFGVGSGALLFLASGVATGFVERIEVEAWIA